jgi:hypothetical protein
MDHRTQLLGIRNEVPVLKVMVLLVAAGSLGSDIVSKYGA